MDDSEAKENLYFNGEVGEDVDKHKENVEKALFLYQVHKNNLIKTQAHILKSSHYEDGVYINNLATLKRSNFFGLVLRRTDTKHY